MTKKNHQPDYQYKREEGEWEYCRNQKCQCICMFVWLWNLMFSAVTQQCCRMRVYCRQVYMHANTYSSVHVCIHVPTPLCHDTDHRMLLYQPQPLSLWSCGSLDMWSVPGETSVSWMSASPSMMRWSGRQCEWLAGYYSIMLSSHEINKWASACACPHPLW